MNLNGSAYDVDGIRLEIPAGSPVVTLQLGRGLDIYEYEVTAENHVLWHTDCAVAEIDVENLGSPSISADWIELPSPGAGVRIDGLTHAIRAMRFRITDRIEFEFHLDDGLLTWRNGFHLNGRPVAVTRAD
ncbi:hypothetical protein [Smaragdicoccus niigatensis]|uniref:hypothetical protein n=1 Tax=Smaragdicoccus niigatensis TaxID=359359 RepID=UPI000363EE81|nr:hypothetical protein [Smaragdicoccus niigatensis]